jgi:hypothetical protein
MSKAEKLKAKLRRAETRFKWTELVALLAHPGFEQIEGDGSRVAFHSDTLVIRLHKPHPQKELKAYAVRQVREILQSEGLI